MTKTRSARTHHSPVPAPTCCAVVLPWDGAGHQNRSAEAQLAWLYDHGEVIGWQDTDEAIQVTVRMNPGDRGLATSRVRAVMGPGSVAPACRAVLGCGMVSLASTPAGVRTAPATCCYRVIPSSTTPSVSLMDRPSWRSCEMRCPHLAGAPCSPQWAASWWGDVPSKSASLPGDAMHLVVSTCGNDVLRAEGMLAEPARSMAGALARPYAVCQRFREVYEAMLDVVCARGLAVADPSLICSEAADLANPMEPSVLGGDRGAGHRRAAGPAAAAMTRRAAAS